MSLFNPLDETIRGFTACVVRLSGRQRIKLAPSIMKLYIKNMVCIRCKMIVKQQLKKLSLHHLSVELGEVEILEDLSAVQLGEFKTALTKFGLELMDDRKSILIEKIKKVIVELVHYVDEPLKINFSDYLTQKLNHDYTYMANLFSEVVGINIEHYVIMHKIERVKELLAYDELSLTEISYKLHYSSVPHLCNQFKKITGLTPSHFKHFKENKLMGIVNP
jgi:YesN/AraC family two-component response regulator